MNMVLVLGVNGQDGGFLAEKLLSRGYHVIGADRQEFSKYESESPNFHYVQLDMRNAAAFRSFLLNTRPAVIFHFAAVHGSSGTGYESVWQDMLAVNTGSVQVILEYLRLNEPNAKLVYAGSGKIFGPRYPRRITERSKMRASCLYTITKMGAYDLINYYRTRYGIKGLTLFLFNHESERRPNDFFVPKIVEILAHSISDPAYKGSVVTLDFDCDWGSAEEYMDIAIDISEKVIGNDFVLGTGKTWYARDLVDTLFKNYGLNYEQHVTTERQDAEFSTAKVSYRVINEELGKAIKRIPQCSILEVCDTILRCNYNVAPDIKERNL